MRIVTGGVSDPVRIIGDGLAPDAPVFVSAEIGTIDASTLVVTFDVDITAPCGDCGLGFTVLVNGAPNAITACVIAGGNTVQLTLTNPVVFGDTVTISYDSTVGCIMESTGVTDLATFAAQAVTNNVAGNGLLNNLIAYWPGNEANGDALDMHTNALTLTDTNTVTSNTGKVYALAREYTAANSEYHIRPGDDALLSTGDIDFTLATWCYLGASTGANMTVAGKYNTSAGSREYQIYHDAITTKFGFIVSDNGAFKAASLAAWGSVSLPNSWYFIVGWHDSVANTTNISLNNGAPVSTAWALGVFNGTAAFSIGSGAGVAGSFINGRIGPTMFWKSNAGLGGVLTAAQRTALYNAGAGLPYASFTV